MIVSTVLVLTAGRLSDLFGRKHAYVAGFLVFALASLGAGFAHSGTELILWRVLQGIGGAFLFANAAALVTDAFPKKELGLAMGTNTMVAAVGLVVGPVLGGALIAISWPWVFWFNVPFAVAGAAWGALVLHEQSGRSSERGLDLLGVSLYVVGLTGLVLALSKGGLSGWNNSLVIGGLAAAVVLLPLFVLVERRGRAPMLDLTLFKDRLFSAASAAAFLNGLSRFALMSIAFVMAIVTAAVPKDVLFKIFSGITSGLSSSQLQPFISNMHLALWVLAAISVLGAGISMLRPAHVREVDERLELQEAA